MGQISFKLNKAVLITILAVSCAPCAIAQTNDFFGGSLPGGANPNPNSPQAHAADVARANLPSDYTDDEKRMQKKFKQSISHARGLISKGDRMMKASAGGKNDKDFKKGKILKEIGERSLAELEANNPLPGARKKAENPEQSRTEEQ